MKIVLAEMRDQQLFDELAFEQPVVIVGRDPSQCHIVFDQTAWPMVSRRHAEFRLNANQWTIVDSNSKFGTFIDGQKVAGQALVHAGSTIQLGENGPCLYVVRIEHPNATSQIGNLKTSVDIPSTEFLKTRVDQPNQPTFDTQANLNPDHLKTRVDHTSPDEFKTRVDSPPPESFKTQVDTSSQDSFKTRIDPSTESFKTRVDPPPDSFKTNVGTPNQDTFKTQVDPSLAVNQKVSTQLKQEGSRSLSQALPSAVLEFESGVTTNLGRVQLKLGTTLLGRDLSTDICIDAAAAVVSRRHAEIRWEGNQFVLIDLRSFNGTLLNDQRISSPTPLSDGDRIQLGLGGPVLRFRSTNVSQPTGAHAQVVNLEQKDSSPLPSHTDSLGDAKNFQRTMVLNQSQRSPRPQATPTASQAKKLLIKRSFDNKSSLTVGRASDNDIPLDGLQISNYHAKFLKDGNNVLIEDSGSTNGVYVNGERITAKHTIQKQDVVQLGPFVIQVEEGPSIAVFDTRSKTRIDALDITKIVPNRSGSGTVKLLDDVDLSIQPNEFIGLLGPSGAGKSTLMDALNGMRPPTGGRVYINELDFYQHLDSLKQSIGYVPQEDIIHRELTVYRTLYYIARLRLSRDLSEQEIDQIVNEVMDVTGLSERRNVVVGQLSGGQRKRVSIAVELITQPSVIFLDEPTSGLDPGTEEKIMKLFRQIAESGRTVILTTHAMENVRLFDKIVLLMRGKLIFYGSPQEILAHVNAESFKDLYDKLELPIEEQLKKLPPLSPNAKPEERRAYEERREQITESVAEDWKKRFQSTEVYQRNIKQPLTGIKRETSAPAVTRSHATIADALRQWITLARRYMEVLGRDRLNLMILLGQAPIIALLTYLVVGAKSPRDFPYFMLALVSIWFGTSVSSREIVKERAVYNRERMVNLRLLPYVGSKLLVLSFIVILQCLLLFGTLKLLSVAGLIYLPGIYGGLPQLLTMILTSMVGIAIGLLISATVKTSEMATSLVPLILIPQILFSGLVGVPKGVARVVGAAMPATWSFDEMKRLSTLDTLEEEGSDQQGSNKGLGYYKFIEQENDRKIEKIRQDLEKYKQDATEKMKAYENDMKIYLVKLQSGESTQRPSPPTLGQPPQVEDVQKVSDDLSHYVGFMHSWGSVWLNPLILLVMFLGLVISTVIVLRLQDVR
jgi:ABC transport system ATP-binding/permease protein